MWKDWEDSLSNPSQLTLSSCLELLSRKDVQEFFGDLFDVEKLMQVNLLHSYNVHSVMLLYVMLKYSEFDVSSV